MVHLPEQLSWDAESSFEVDESGVYTLSMRVAQEWQGASTAHKPSYPQSTAAIWSRREAELSRSLLHNKKGLLARGKAALWGHH